MWSKDIPEEEGRYWLHYQQNPRSKPETSYVHLVIYIEGGPKILMVGNEELRDIPADSWWLAATEPAPPEHFVRKYPVASPAKRIDWASDGCVDGIYMDGRRVFHKDGYIANIKLFTQIFGETPMEAGILVREELPDHLTVIREKNAAGNTDWPENLPDGSEADIPLL